MASPSPPAPPPLPITTPTTTAASTSILSLLPRLTTTLRSSLSHRRPWTELIDRTSFSRPLSLSDAAYRLRRNASYFKINYLTLIGIVLALSLLTHPVSLVFLAALLSAWVFLYFQRTSPLTVFGRTFSDRETLGILILSTVIVVFLTSVGSVLVYAILVGVSIVSVHGAFRDPEDLFLDEQENPGAGLLSFLGGAATSAAGPTGPARV